MKGKITTIGFGTFVMLLAAVFIILLMFHTGNQLAPITEKRIADCNLRAEAYKADLEYASRTGACEDDIKYLNTLVNTYENRAKMLERRDMYYSISMLMPFGVLIVLVLVYISNFSKSTVTDDGRVKRRYMPLISAPVTAVCVLMAIGITYRAIFSVEKTDVVILAGSVVLGFLTFIICRRIPAIFSRRIGASLISRKKTVGFDVLLFAFITLIILALLAVNVLFGKTINGAKLWVDIGFTDIQPGEFVKVFLVLLFALSYGKKWCALCAVGVAVICLGTMALLHDLGSAVVIFAMIMVMLLLLFDNKITFSLFHNKMLFIVLSLVAVALSIVLITLVPYAAERLENCGKAMELNNQQAQMLKTLAFSGYGGLGIENSSHILNIYAADNDMAIAGVAAVFGMGMLTIVMLCYGVIIVVPLRKYVLYRQYYFAAALVSTVIAIQVLMNALGSIDMLPFTGIVAPFISSGGSATAAFCMMFGIVLAALHPAVKPLEVN